MKNPHRSKIDTLHQMSLAPIVTHTINPHPPRKHIENSSRCHVVPTRFSSLHSVRSEVSRLSEPEARDLTFGRAEIFKGAIQCLSNPSGSFLSETNYNDRWALDERLHQMENAQWRVYTHGHVVPHACIFFCFSFMSDAFSLTSSGSVSVNACFSFFLNTQ